MIQIKNGTFEAAIESLDEITELWVRGEELGRLVGQCG